MGLGLAIARSIAAAHAATLHAEPRPAGGLDITVSMPLAAATAPMPDTSPS